jgi:hypothetical protein
VPEGHRLAEAESVGIAELADESWIAGCPRCRRQLVDVCEEAGFTPRIDFATDDYPAVVGLVGAGLGVAVLPTLAIESVRPRGAKVVSVEPAVQREIVALTLPDLAQVPAVAATLAELTRATALIGPRSPGRHAPVPGAPHAPGPRAVRLRGAGRGAGPAPSPGSTRLKKRSFRWAPHLPNVLPMPCWTP